MLVSGRVARSPVRPARVREARAVWAGLRAHLPVSPQQLGDVSMSLMIEYDNDNIDEVDEIMIVMMIMLIMMMRRMRRMRYA